MIRRCSLLVAFCLLVLPALASAAPTRFAPPPGPHTLVRLHLDTPAAEAWLQAHRSGLDILQIKPGAVARIAALPRDLELLGESGLRFEILQRDMESAQAYRDKAAGFGIFHTYSENTAFVDSLRLLYPNVVSEKWSIGQSHLGNDLWCFRVSANPDIDENEPEMLIDGMHHAREIMASEFPILFSEYLAQNYGSDPEVTWLLDNRELYIVPIVNPDGVLYNESINPGGGGMWRKNYRDNGNGTYGVDPNRNYPWQWGYDDLGSSPDPGATDYRGPSAGSEPEVQALMSLIAGREFVTHNTIHSFSNLTLYPWGYIDVVAPDPAFPVLGEAMCRYNGYFYGTPVEAINYAVNGGTIDWSYGQHDVLSFSNEIGGPSDGFWPPPERRGPLFRENIWPMMYLLRAAGSFVAVRSATTTPATPTKSIGPGEDGLLDFTIESQGARTGVPATDLTITSDDPWLQLNEGTRSIGALPPLTSTTLGAAAIGFSVDAGCPNGHVAVVDVAVALPGSPLSYSLPLLIGAPAPLLADDLESGGGNWTLTGDWALSTEEARSGSYCLTDSPGADYGNDIATTATLNGVYRATKISYWQKYSIETDYDYGKLQISDDGESWITVHAATGRQQTWEYVEVDLAEYLGSDLQIRFLMESDTYVIDDGWWIDDIQVEGMSTDNLPPSTPVALQPTSLPDTAPAATIGVLNAIDPEGEPLTYGFRIYADELCTQPLAETTAQQEGTEYTLWTPPALADGDYWWRAWADDGTERSLLVEPQLLSVNSGSPVADGGVAVAGLRVLTPVSGGRAQLRLDLPRAGRVEVDLYDARGARVRRLHSGSLESGSRVLVWDGRSDAGRNVASGVYLVRVRTVDQVLTGRVVIVR